MNPVVRSILTYLIKYLYLVPLYQYYIVTQNLLYRFLLMHGKCHGTVCTIYIIVL